MNACYSEYVGWESQQGGGFETHSGDFYIWIALGSGYRADWDVQEYIDNKIPKTQDDGIPKNWVSLLGSKVLACLMEVKATQIIQYL